MEPENPPNKIHCDTCQADVGWMTPLIINMTSRGTLYDTDVTGGKIYCLKCGVPDESEEL